MIEHRLSMLFGGFHPSGFGAPIASLQNIRTEGGVRRVFAPISVKYPNCTEGIRTNDTITDNEDSPCFNSSDSSSTESSELSTGLGCMTVCQLAAALPTPATISPICGLCVLSPSQHLWMRFHKELEIPIASAFSGLPGRTPDKTWRG